MCHLGLGSVTGRAWGDMTMTLSTQGTAVWTRSHMGQAIGTGTRGEVGQVGQIEGFLSSPRVLGRRPEPGLMESKDAPSFFFSDLGPTSPNCTFSLPRA